MPRIKRGRKLGMVVRTPRQRERERESEPGKSFECWRVVIRPTVSQSVSFFLTAVVRLDGGLATQRGGGGEGGGTDVIAAGAPRIDQTAAAAAKARMKTERGMRRRR